MNNLEKFISARIAHEEAIHYVTRTHGSPDERERAERWISECDMKRWILDYYNKASRSADPTAPAVWGTLTQVLFKMASQWRDHADYNPAWSPLPDEPETFSERSGRLYLRSWV